MNNYSQPVNIVSKVRKAAFGIVVNEGERVKVFLNSAGHAYLIRNENLKFKPDEYELYIPEEDFAKLLTSAG